eukprot:CAMPEP_0185300480 /NCGR_PEP_ID=MMETSP1363-20130426/12057_1 /TAXON_ID=38817 /ORGANISM="Gephyrocapsa oceanica, Strain RCC1303" /LENGTH=98 /DNA_ID=CAMNT_0027897443 /DNA_START=21 /DNA_END=317 /DNA_ORIENTATION=+
MGSHSQFLSARAWCKYLRNGLTNTQLSRLLAQRQEAVLVVAERDPARQPPHLANRRRVVRLGGASSGAALRLVVHVDRRGAQLGVALLQSGRAQASKA